MYIEDQLLPLMWAGFGDNPATFLGGALAELLHAIAYALVTRRCQGELWRFLRLLEAVAVAHFRFGAGQTAFMLEFDQQKLQLTPENHSERLGVDEWAIAAHSSIVLADLDGLGFLIGLDDEVFLDADGASSAFDLAYYHYLANFYGQRHKINEYYADAVAAAKQAQAGHLRAFFIKSVRLPELKLLHTMLIGDQANINEALRLALIAHRRFWSQPAQALAAEGWLSLPLLAACAWGWRNRGFWSGIQSAYLPIWLLEAQQPNDL
jgi:hypothetical protein